MELPRVATSPFEMSKPLHCPFPATVSPHAEALQRDSVAWARRMQIANSAAGISALDRSRVGWLVARAVPNGEPEALALATDWTTFFCLLDDHVEGLAPLAASDLLAGLFRGFCAGKPESNHPLAQALDDLRRRMGEQCDRAWIDHFEGLVDQLFTNFILEAIHRANGRCPDLDTYRAMREVTVGLRPEFALAEIACGAVLTPQERANPIVQQLTAAAARSVGWANDLFTCVREMGAGEVHNLVVVLVTHEDLTPSAAATRAAQMHDAEVRQVEQLDVELFAREQREQLRIYIDCVKSWIRGHMDWAAQTGRYGTIAFSQAA